MRYPKVAKTVAEQADLLLLRGMVADRDLLITRLSEVNYYRLSAYWFSFRNPANDQLLPGTDFEIIWDRYVFDRQLRQQLQAHHRVMAVVSNTPIPQHSKLHFIYICVLVILRLKTPEAYDKIMNAESLHTAWTEFANQQELTADIFEIVNEYFILMGALHGSAFLELFPRR